jgi:hypothetical protein
VLIKAISTFLFAAPPHVSIVYRYDTRGAVTGISYYRPLQEGISTDTIALLIVTIISGKPRRTSQPAAAGRSSASSSRTAASSVSPATLVREDSLIVDSTF